MLTLRDPVGAVSSNPERRWLGRVISVMVHGLVVIAVVGVWHRAPRMQHYKLPGTAEGVRFLPYYRPGGVEAAASQLVVKKVPEKDSVAVMHAPAAPVTPPKVEAKETPAIEKGLGASAQSGLGEGDVTIALQTYFPYPKPDLSGLARGTRGDVILNAVIDEHGKISELTLLKGLGEPIDGLVIATVKQWTYTPAKKNGVPIPCEQELHFHYERG